MDYIFNPRAGTGTATVTAVANDGTFTDLLPLGNGNNFLTITTAANETLSSVMISAPGGFAAYQQPRVSGLAAISSVATAVPEPSLLLLFGAGLALLAGLGWSRSRQ